MFARRRTMSATTKMTPVDSLAIEAAIEEALAGGDVLTADERASVRAALVDLSIYVHTPGGATSKPPSVVKMSTWL
jgi:hypothetical protein